MTYKVEDIVHDVRVAIDMNAPDRHLLTDGDEDTLQLDTLIASKVIDACREILLEAPISKLDGVESFKDVEIAYSANGRVHIMILPQDFMRLIAFKLSGWEYTCHSTIGVESPIYAMQSSRFTGIRGNSERPVCAITVCAKGRVLEVYGGNSDATVERADYLPEPFIDGDGNVKLPQQCYRACVHRIGALVLATLGDKQWPVLQSMSNALLGKSDPVVEA